MVKLRRARPSGGRGGVSAALVDEGVLERCDGPPIILLGEYGRDPGLVDPLQWAAWTVQRRGGDGDDAPGCDLTGDVELVADGAAGVDRVEDRLVAVADGGAAAAVGASDVDDRSYGAGWVNVRKYPSGSWSVSSKAPHGRTSTPHSIGTTPAAASCTAWTESVCT